MRPYKSKENVNQNYYNACIKSKLKRKFCFNNKKFKLKCSYLKLFLIVVFEVKLRYLLKNAFLSNFHFELFNF